MRAVSRAAALVGADTVRSSQAPATGDAKGLPGDWVTDTDLASERAIAEFLGAQTPDIPLYGEELGGDEAALRWVVDPLDGTTNFVHGFWAVGVSVALVAEDQPVVGAIAAPFMGDCWHAAAGAGRELGAARRRLDPVRHQRPDARGGRGRHRVPLPAQGSPAALPGGDGAGARALRGPAAPRRRLPGPGLDRLRRVRRVLRAWACRLGRRGRRAARARGRRASSPTGTAAAGSCPATSWRAPPPCTRRCSRSARAEPPGDPTQRVVR